MAGLGAPPAPLHPSPPLVTLGSTIGSPGHDARLLPGLAWLAPGWAAARSWPLVRPLGRRPGWGGQRWVLSSFPSLFPPLGFFSFFFFLGQGRQGGQWLCIPVSVPRSSNPGRDATGGCVWGVPQPPERRAASHPAARSRAGVAAGDISVSRVSRAVPGAGGDPGAWLLRLPLAFARRMPALPKSSCSRSGFNPRPRSGGFCTACGVWLSCTQRNPLFGPDRGDRDRRTGACSPGWVAPLSRWSGGIGACPGLEPRCFRSRGAVLARGTVLAFAPGRLGAEVTEPISALGNVTLGGTEGGCP